MVGGPKSKSTRARFYIGIGGGEENSNSRRSHTFIMNLDMLNVLHTTLLTHVTLQKWEALGHGSCTQKKVMQAYEKWCKCMGGGWDEEG